MNAAEIANSISDGVNTIAGLVEGLASAKTPRTYAAELAGDLLTLILALEALRGSTEIDGASELPANAVDDLRRLHAVVVAWRDTGIVSPQVEPLAHQCLTTLKACSAALASAQ